MTPFIYPYQANFLRNELKKLLRVVYFVGDWRVYQATKEQLESTIEMLFGPMSPAQAALFDGISEVKGQQDLNDYMNRVTTYVVPFACDTEQIRKAFKKTKRLTLPNLDEFDLKTMTYLGWRDIGAKVLYFVYPYKGELTGIRARYTPVSGTSNICSLCNQALSGSETGLVVAETKSSTYKSVGNYMCLDSAICNQRITSVQAIEDFYARVLTK